MKRNSKLEDELKKIDETVELKQEAEQLRRKEYTKILYQRYQENIPILDEVVEKLKEEKNSEGLKNLVKSMVALKKSC